MYMLHGAMIVRLESVQNVTGNSCNSAVRQHMQLATVLYLKLCKCCCKGAVVPLLMCWHVAVMHVHRPSETQPACWCIMTLYMRSIKLSMLTSNDAMKP
jgi:hypothetical protein